MYEFMLLVPVCAADNQGNPVPSQVTPFDDICTRFCEVCGGCTLGPVYEGMWLYEGNLIKEDVRPLYFAINGPPEDTYETALDLAEAVRMLLNQKCVYLRNPDMSVTFVG